MLVTKCGKTQSNSRKPFTRQTLAQHNKDCPYCNRSADENDMDINDLGLEMTDLLAGDEPDGVFWGMAWELGEWY